MKDNCVRYIINDKGYKMVSAGSLSVKDDLSFLQKEQKYSNNPDNFYLRINYYKNGYYHRDDGPAEISHKEIGPRRHIKFDFYLEGKAYSFDDFCKKTNHLKCNYCKFICNQKCFFY